MHSQAVLEVLALGEIVVRAAAAQLAGDVKDRTRVHERIAQQRAHDVIPIQPLVS